MKGNNQAYKLWLCLLCSFILLPLEIQAQEKGDSITGKVHKIDEERRAHKGSENTDG